MVTNQKENGNSVPAREIFETRMRDAFWGIGERTPNRQSLDAGDRVIFYVGIPEAVFAGSATLATSIFRLQYEERLRFSHDRKIFKADYGVRLSGVHIWNNPIKAQGKITSLSFVENVQFWGSYFQGGIRGISDADYETLSIRQPSPDIAIRGDTRDIENVSEFALESHLEEFLHANWAKVQWGRPLQLYKTPESSGRQFPAGTWSIDFLAIDQGANTFVVIELKRGQTSDSTIGQVLRYMQWVRENITEVGQKVEGLIVCRAMDEALRLSVRSQQDISVLTYAVDFKLVPDSTEYPG